VIWWIAGGIYTAGFLLVLVVNVMSGPVTVPLSIARAAVWPVWVATGHPEGVRQIPD
jgi:hypothetical protein